MTNNSLSDSSLVLAIDIGTTSLKAAFVRGDGEVFSFKRVEYWVAGATREFASQTSQRDRKSKNGAAPESVCKTETVAANEKSLQNQKGAAAWSEALKTFLPSPLLAECAAVSVSGNGPTIVSADGTTLMWNEDCSQAQEAAPATDGKPAIGAATENGGKPETGAADDNRSQDQKGAAASDENLSSKLDVPDVQKKIYQPRLAAFARLFPDEWEHSPRLYTSTQWLCAWIKDNAAALGLANDIPVFDAGPDFIAALVGTGTLSPGRLCDRAGSSEGLNLCAPNFFEAADLRTMPSPAQNLWNVSCLIADPGNSRQEKLDNFKKAFNALKGAAAAQGAPFGDFIMVTGGQALDEQLLQEKADTVGVKVATAQISDAELLGGAAAAFFRLGKYSSLEEAAKGLVRVGKEFLPGEASWSRGQSRGAGPQSLACKQSNFGPQSSSCDQSKFGDQSPLADGASRSCEQSSAGDSSPSQETYPRFFNIPSDLRAIIFDIDSTLYTNAAYAFEQVDCQVRRFASLRGITNDEARKMVADYRKKFARENGGKKISLSNTLLQFGISIEQSVQWRRELIEPADFLGPDKELQKTLAKLSARYKLLCVTNNPILPAQKTLDALGIEKFIEVLVGLDSCNLSKPAKEPFLLAAKKIGLAPSQMISVGDRYDLDIAPALELGMGGVLVRGVADVCMLPELMDKV